MEIRDSLIAAFRRADRSGANQLLGCWAEKHGYERTFTEVLEPALLAVGDEWSISGSWTLAQTYVAAKVAEDVLGEIAARSELSSADRPVKGPVVIGNIEDDFHSLGRRMVGIFLRTEGWIVNDLGNDVAPAAFVDEAVRVRARVVGASAMMLTTARNIGRLREELDERGLGGRIQLAVGGAVFLYRQGLAEEVGGDGTAPNALGASKLFADLWARSAAREVPT
jgi:methanogenic corrinoid protein MtbC1